MCVCVCTCVLCDGCLGAKCVGSAQVYSRLVAMVKPSSSSLFLSLHPPISIHPSIHPSIHLSIYVSFYLLHIHLYSCGLFPHTNSTAISLHEHTLCHANARCLTSHALASQQNDTFQQLCKSLRLGHHKVIAMSGAATHPSFLPYLDSMSWATLSSVFIFGL